jgi:hypothetical protein
MDFPFIAQELSVGYGCETEIGGNCQCLLHCSALRRAAQRSNPPSRRGMRSPRVRSASSAANRYRRGPANRRKSSSCSETMASILPGLPWRAQRPNS